MRNKWIAALLMVGMMMPTLIQAEVVEDSVRNTYISEEINSEVAYINEVNEEEINPDEGIMPIFTSINDISASINISNGIATVSGSTSALRSGKVETIVKLQQFCDNQWKTLATWSSKEEYFSMVEKSKAVKKGYSYRVQVTGKAYDSNGKVIEQATVNSQSQYY